MARIRRHRAAAAAALIVVPLALALSGCVAGGDAGRTSSAPTATTVPTVTATPTTAPPGAASCDGLADTLSALIVQNSTATAGYTVTDGRPADLVAQLPAGVLGDLAPDCVVVIYSVAAASSQTVGFVVGAPAGSVDDVGSRLQSSGWTSVQVSSGAGFVAPTPDPTGVELALLDAGTAAGLGFSSATLTVSVGDWRVWQTF